MLNHHQTVNVKEAFKRTSKNDMKRNVRLCLFESQYLSAVKENREDDGNIQEALQCMKTLTERVSKRDDCFVDGEHVGNKLRSCGKSIAEISIAQHHIEEISF
jgi:hypothetical protein